MLCGKGTKVFLQVSLTRKESDYYARTTSVSPPEDPEDGTIPHDRIIGFDALPGPAGTIAQVLALEDPRRDPLEEFWRRLNLQLKGMDPLERSEAIAIVREAITEQDFIQQRLSGMSLYPFYPLASFELKQNVLFDGPLSEPAYHTLLYRMFDFHTLQWISARAELPEAFNLEQVDHAFSRVELAAKEAIETVPEDRDEILEITFEWMRVNHHSFMRRMRGMGVAEDERIFSGEMRVWEREIVPRIINLGRRR